MDYILQYGTADMCVYGRARDSGSVLQNVIQV